MNTLSKILKLLGLKYVVATGTLDYWTYTEYSDGTFVASYAMDFTAKPGVAILTAGANGVYVPSVTESARKYPRTYKTIDYTNAYISKGSVNMFTGGGSWANGVYTFRPLILSNTNSIPAHTVNIDIRGIWK